MKLVPILVSIFLIVIVIIIIHLRRKSINVSKAVRHDPIPESSNVYQEPYQSVNSQTTTTTTTKFSELPQEIILQFSELPQETTLQSTFSQTTAESFEVPQETTLQSTINQKTTIESSELPHETALQSTVSQTAAESSQESYIIPMLESLFSPFISDINTYKGLVIIPKPPILYNPKKRIEIENAIVQPFNNFLLNYNKIHRYLYNDVSFNINYLLQNSSYDKGYYTKNPTILIFPWNIHDFKPNVYTDQSEIQDVTLQNHINAVRAKSHNKRKKFHMDKLWISCTHAASQDIFIQGFSKYDFPIKENSLPPFVVMKLELQDGNNEVECKMVAKNINSSETFASIKFNINLEVAEVDQETGGRAGGLPDMVPDYESRNIIIDRM